MNKYYFTYGTNNLQPFVGGWTEIEAPDITDACALFRMFHPDRSENTLNCSSVYDESYFVTTSMFKNGSYGFRCHERISVQRQLVY
jgi:hypothetical protein